MRLAPTQRLLAAGLALAILLTPTGAFADRTVLKPGTNRYTPQQDIALGQKAAREEEKKLPMCNAPEVDAYLTKLGHKLIDHLDTGGVAYPWEFHCVNDKAVNAFALPGGYVFVNRGAIEVADYEAELAGVMAHELSHVALRHGTSQLTKAENGQALGGIASVVGSILGGGLGAAVGAVGQLGVGSVLLKYSRGAETQADVMGTQVLYDAGYDPRALAAFFEKISSDSSGRNPPTFFSDHPSPDNRTGRVQEEVTKLGGVPEGAKRDSAEFESIKRQVMALPVVSKPQAPTAQGSGAPPPGAIKVGPPSENYVPLQTSAYTLKYPDNWKRYGKGNDVTLAPDGGVVDSGNGQAALAYGVIVSVAQMQGNPPANADALNAATQKLIESLQQENANMKITREPKPVTLNGEQGLSTYLENDSPAGGVETDWLITVLRPEGLVYFVCAAPKGEYRNFDKAFGAILDSVRFQK
jgi:Zn-dependent protease with chaperone function